MIGELTNNIMTTDKNVPSFIIRRVDIPEEGTEPRAIRVGVCFAYKSGKGHTMILETLDGGVIQLLPVEPKEGKNLPAFRAYRVIEPSASAPETAKARWIEVGAAWESEQKNGYHLYLNLVSERVALQMKTYEPKKDTEVQTEIEDPGIINPEDISVLDISINEKKKRANCSPFFRCPKETST